MNKQPWTDNDCTIFAFKSDRKNATVISEITLRHLITHNDNGCLNESTIENYFVGIIAQLVYDIKYHACTINITTLTTINHMTSYWNCNSELYNHYHDIHINECRKHFFSIEQLINHIYNILLLVYPYTRLDIKTIYNNSSIKYYINLYYSHN